MAFAGLMFVGLILIMLGILGGLGLLLLLIAIIFRVKKKRKASTVLFIISGVMLGSVLIIILLAVIPKSKTVPTPAGDAVIKPSWIEKYEDCLETHNIDELSKLVDKHPELIYYYDANYVMLLDYGLDNCDIDIMQIALDKGAVFDDPLRYDHMVFYSSFDAFFSELDYPDWEKNPDELTVRGQTTDEMIHAVAFAIEHGAKLKWEVNHDEADNLFDKAVIWINEDGIISEKDEAFLKMIAESDPEMQELFDNWKIQENK